MDTIGWIIMIVCVLLFVLIAWGILLAIKEKNKEDGKTVTNGVAGIIGIIIVGIFLLSFAGFGWMLTTLDDYSPSHEYVCGFCGRTMSGPSTSGMCSNCTNNYKNLEQFRGK